MLSQQQQQLLPSICLSLGICGGLLPILALVLLSNHPDAAATAPKTSNPAYRKHKQRYTTTSIIEQQQHQYKLWMFTLVLVLSILGYGYSVGQLVRVAEESVTAATTDQEDTLLFDPYTILGIPNDNMDPAQIKQIYRNLLLKVKQAEATTSQEQLVQDIQYAYTILTQPESPITRNYLQYGHPQGKQQQSTAAKSSHHLFVFQWHSSLYQIQDNNNHHTTTSTPLYIVYGTATLAALGLLYSLWHSTSNNNNKNNNKNSLHNPLRISEMNATSTVSLEDLLYLSQQLSPQSNHYQVLATVLSTPEMIQQSLQQYQHVQYLRQQRIEQQQQELSKKKNNDDDYSFEELMNQGGWADDDEDNDNQQQNDKEQDKERIDKATGKITEKMEGIDPGVLGQEWVEQTLAQKQLWPPTPLTQFLTTQKDTSPLSPLDHPGLRRNLCMTMARLHSHYLNTNPELLQAGMNKLVDQTYFKDSMEFRGRVGLVLEAALRLAMSLRSYSLVSTVIETVAMYKVGVHSPFVVESFNQSMIKQYGILPHLKIMDKKIETEGEQEIATNDACQLTVRMERPYAENFMKQKVMMCQKQGIPPQLALQGYREAWWLLVYVERLDGPDPPIEIQQGPINEKMAPEDLAKFEKDEKRLLTCWPMMVQSIAQKGGNINLSLMAPKVPGKYRYHVSIKSQDFLGADVQFSLDADVVDIESLGREAKKPKAPSAEAPADAAAGGGDEPKKEK